jgi:hypothetical protein
LADMSTMATLCIEWGNPESMLVTTMIEGLNPYWHYQLYNKQMAHEEKVYNSCYEFIFDAETRHKVWQRISAGQGGPPQRGSASYKQTHFAATPGIRPILRPVPGVYRGPSVRNDGSAYGMDPVSFAAESKGKHLGGSKTTMGVGLIMLARYVEG